MPLVASIDIVDRFEQPAVCIRQRAFVEKMPFLIGACLGRIAGFLSQRCIFPADIPYVAFKRPFADLVDIEIGYPLKEPFSAFPSDDVFLGRVPGGRVVFCIYQGDYNLKLRTQEMYLVP